MTTSLRHARSIQQKLLSSKESIRSILSYNGYRKDDPICSDKELLQKLKRVDKEIGDLLGYVKTLEDKSRRQMREEIFKKEEGLKKRFKKEEGLKKRLKKEERLKKEGDK